MIHLHTDTHCDNSHLNKKEEDQLFFQVVELQFNS